MTQEEIDNMIEDWLKNGFPQELKALIPEGEKGTCSGCGCTWDNACIAPIHGACWWIDETETMCSHCHYGYEEVKG
ncbi:TPA: hypothetical protein ACGO97_000758 [Streptococcus suis]